MSSIEEIVMAYFEAWQTKDWETMRSYLAPSFQMDGGKIQFQSRDTFIDFCKHGPSWHHIELLDALFLENKAALLYEGTTATGERIRVGEFLQIENRKLVSSKVAISLA